MASHGVSRHGRYERLLRRHRFDTKHADRDETVLDTQRATDPEQKTTRSRNLHEQWVAIHEKREQIGSPSTLLVPTVPEVTSSTTSDSSATTETESETTASDGSTIGETTATEARPTAEAAPINEPETTASEDESAPTLTQPVVSETSSYQTNVLSSDQQATEQSTATETIVEPTLTAVTTSITAPTIEADTETVTEETTSTTDQQTAVSSVVDTTTTTDLPDSTTDTPGTEALSESAGLVAGLAAESESTSTYTEDLPTPSTSTSDTESTDTTSSTLSTSVPIIGQAIESSDKSPISLGSSLDIPTAVAVGQTPSSTSTQAVIAAIAAESSTSTSDSTDITTTTTNTPTDASSTSSTTFTTTISTTTSDTTLSITSSTTTTTTTSYASHTTYSDSTTGGYGWGDSDNPENTTGSSPESTGAGSSGSESNSDSGSGTLSPQTTGKIVGGVVGGVAAATVIFLLIFLLLRRRRKTGFFFSSPARVKGDDRDGGLIRGPSTRQMVSRDSDGAASFGAAYFAPAFMKRWRQSQMSTGEESLSSTEPSERGFQKISGRKLPSGVHPDFDYSAGGLEAGSPTESDLSPTLPPVIPRPSSSSRPPLSNPFSAPLDTSFTREVDEDDVVFVRPSPARTPTAGSSNATTWAEASARAMPMAFPMPPSGTPSIPKRPDALGRSHPSYDGSRGSRFSENL
ncbi:hypothetical protein BJY01DRAFT_243474 [Aspergillus pseudoustus]|uniref:Mid2 domain-containing protein n=1 Tax=Aspergillus pseudoustus TaxID=1810923 RepID=A0ABR4KSP0_9EURO